MKLEDVFKAAKKSGSYLVTATIRDKTRSENDLIHHTVREDFPNDDVIPSLDVCVRQMGVKPPQPVDIPVPEKVFEDRRPLKIAVVTHFNRAPDSYSPGRAVKNQIKLLQQYGHEVVFFVTEGSKLDVGCEMRPVVPKFRREKWVVNEEAKDKIVDMLREQLTDDFDLAITHDFYIDDCITFREAISECGVDIEWLHWARSGIGKGFSWKMPNARYVYMNFADAGVFARKIGVDPEDVRVVFNEKDPSLLFQWHPVTKMISDKMRLWEKDIIQTFPICTTRMDAKGLNSVLAAFGEMKRLGYNVALIVCNSNGRRRIDEINSKIDRARECGLTEEDFVFTSTLSSDEHQIHSEVPNKVVSELMQVSNVFILPTIAEVCSNILLEASMTKNLLVLNEDLPCLFDFADEKAVLSYPFTSSKSLHYSGRTSEEFSELAKKIVGQVMSNKADRQFRKVWRTHSIDSLYRNILEPVLYERVKKETKDDVGTPERILPSIFKN